MATKGPGGVSLMSSRSAGFPWIGLPAHHQVGIAVSVDIGEGAAVES
jgi:hypothetical protein